MKLHAFGALLSCTSICRWARTAIEMAGENGLLTDCCCIRASPRAKTAFSRCCRMTDSRPRNRRRASTKLFSCSVVSSSPACTLSVKSWDWTHIGMVVLVQVLMRKHQWGFFLMACGFVKEACASWEEGSSSCLCILSVPESLNSLTLARTCIILSKHDIRLWGYLICVMARSTSVSRAFAEGQMHYLLYD